MKLYNDSYIFVLNFNEDYMEGEADQISGYNNSISN